MKPEYLNKVLFCLLIGCLIGWLSTILWPGKPLQDERVYRKGNDLLRQGSALEAKGYFQAHAEKGDIAAIVGYAFAAFETGDSDTAYELCIRVLEDDEADDSIRARAYYIIGQVEHFDGNYQRSIAAMEQAREFYQSLSKDLGVYLANYSIAQSLMELGRYQGAIETLESLEPTESRKGKHYYELYTAHYLKGNYEIAGDYYARADKSFSEDDPERIYFYSTAGWFELLKGNNELGKELSEKAIKLALAEIESRKERRSAVLTPEDVLTGSQVDTRDLAWVKLNRLLYVDCASDVYQDSLILCSSVAKTDARLRKYLLEALERQC